MRCAAVANILRHDSARLDLDSARSVAFSKRHGECDLPTRRHAEESRPAPMQGRTMSPIHALLVKELSQPGLRGSDLNRPDIAPSGSGAPLIRPVAAAIANAIFDITGVRMPRLPFSPDRVKAALSSGPSSGCASSSCRRHRGRYSWCKVSIPGTPTMGNPSYRCERRACCDARQHRRSGSE